MQIKPKELDKTTNIGRCYEDTVYLYQLGPLFFVCYELGYYDAEFYYFYFDDEVEAQEKFNELEAKGYEPVYEYKEE